MLEAADSYDVSALYYDLAISGAVDNAAPQVDFFAALARGRERVLDIGAGTGRGTLKIAEQARVWCIEPSRSMRAILTSRIVHSSLPRHQITVLPCDSDACAELAESFDYVVIAGVLGLLSCEQRADMFSFAAARMRPGALIAMDMASDRVFSAMPSRLISDVRLGDIRYTAHVEIDSVLDYGQAAKVRYLYRSYMGSMLLAREEQVRLHYACNRMVLLDQVAAAGLQVIAASEVRRRVKTPVPDDALVAWLPE